MRSLSLMRVALQPSRLLRAGNAATTSAPATVPTPPTPRRCSDPYTCFQHCRCFAHVQDLDRLNREVWFTASTPRLSTPPPPTPSSSSFTTSFSGTPRSNNNDHQPPDERTLQLGRTVRVLHERLPTLLKEPLPSDILSPQISLHLFPSTHPHLPTVSGRLAYVAALWTAPVAWGRVPLVGNVQLTIVSERMVRHGGGGCGGRSTAGAGAGVGGGPTAAACSSSTRDERLIVKWRTCGKTTHRDGSGGIYRGMGIAAKDPVDKIKEFIAGAAKREAAAAETEPEEPAEEFCGIFVFEFDELGRVVKHVIEHTDEGGRWDKMTRVVSVTDWLLGRFNGKNKEAEPALAFCEERPSAGRIHLVDRSGRS